jgi:ornithine decarboxylase
MAFDLAQPRDAADWLTRNPSHGPVFLFCPQALAATARTFLTGFQGLVTYAVKANPDARILQGLHDAGLRAFDVASPDEMARVRAVAPDAVLHYHNPIRSRAEIDQARHFGVAGWSVDRMSELDKLGALHGAEVAVRLKLPVAGAAYDFGSKFGAPPELAEALLRAVADRGGRPSMTFHPGTQCPTPDAWQRYIAACAEIARAAGLRLHRLNVGGGFPAHRGGAAPDLQAIFDAIADAARDAFDGTPPALVCEPGRAMVAECMALAVTVKAVDEGAVFLDDGIYGALSEWRDIAPGDRVRVVAADGLPRMDPAEPRIVFGPTCDSLDRLPHPLPLPVTIVEGDRLIFAGMGAYSACLVTGFNGYGTRRIEVLHGA